MITIRDVFNVLITIGVVHTVNAAIDAPLLPLSISIIWTVIAVTGAIVWGRKHPEAQR